jgi:nitroreductase
MSGETIMKAEDFKELVLKNRTCRRFDNNYKIDMETLKYLVSLARNAASAANNQPLKYYLCRDDKKNEEIFSCLSWAAYLTDWPGPEKEERPSAYIVITGDSNISNNFWCDHGISAQTILLGARTLGLAGCIFGAINIKKLQYFLNIPDHLKVKLVLAIGKPVEIACIDEVGQDGCIKYWRDENMVHRVPKRKLEDIIVGCF